MRLMAKIEYILYLILIKGTKLMGSGKLGFTFVNCGHLKKKNFKCPQFTKVVWAYNKPPFLKLIKSLYVSLQSQFTCFCKSNINQTLPTALVWYEEWGLQFSQKSDIWYKNWSPFCLFLDFKICAIWQLDYKVSWYQLECNERELVWNEACPNLLQLLRVWYFMWALKHAQQVSW